MACSAARTSTSSWRRRRSLAWVLNGISAAGGGTARGSGIDVTPRYGLALLLLAKLGTCKQRYRFSALCYLQLSCLNFLSSSTAPSRTAKAAVTNLQQYVYTDNQETAQTT